MHRYVTASIILTLLQRCWELRSIWTGHKRQRLRGNPQNACQGLLEIESDDGGSWVPVNMSNSISPEVSCTQMFCGTKASLISDDKGTQLTCTGNTTEHYKTLTTNLDKTTFCVCPQTKFQLSWWTIMKRVGATVRSTSKSTAETILCVLPPGTRLKLKWSAGSSAVGP